VTLAAVEPRLKTVVLQGTGLSDNVPPEIDPVNYAPRIVMPTLMLNGRYDFGSPVETSQRPLFALLGASTGQKRHAIIESGHALSIDDVTREILPWLDRYLGRVVR
jgi:pimeloyl-ACP methyl ester carboxylesterase